MYDIVITEEAGSVAIKENNKPEGIKNASEIETKEEAGSVAVEENNKPEDNKDASEKEIKEEAGSIIKINNLDLERPSDKENGKETEFITGTFEKNNDPKKYRLI